MKEQYGCIHCNSCSSIRFGVRGGEEGHLFWEGGVEVLEDGGRIWNDVVAMLQHRELHALMATVTLGLWPCGVFAKLLSTIVHVKTEVSRAVRYAPEVGSWWVCCSVPWQVLRTSATGPLWTLAA